MADYLFSNAILSDVLENQKQEMKNEIQELDQDYLLNVSETDLCAHLIDKYGIEPPALRRQDIYVQHHGETNVDVREDFRRAVYDRSRPSYVKGTLVTIAVPFDGEAGCFQLRANTFSLNPPRGKVSGQEILLTYAGADLTAEQLKQTYERDVSHIESSLQATRGQLRAFNDDLPRLVQEAVSSRKRKLLVPIQLDGTESIQMAVGGARPSVAPREVPADATSSGQMRGII